MLTHEYTHRSKYTHKHTHKIPYAHGHVHAHIVSHTGRQTLTNLARKVTVVEQERLNIKGRQLIKMVEAKTIKILTEP